MCTTRKIQLFFFSMVWPFCFPNNRLCVCLFLNKFIKKKRKESFLKKKIKGKKNKEGKKKKKSLLVRAHHRDTSYVAISILVGANVTWRVVYVVSLSKPGNLRKNEKNPRSIHVISVLSEFGLYIKEWSKAKKISAIVTLILSSITSTKPTNQPSSSNPLFVFGLSLIITFWYFWRSSTAVLVWIVKLSTYGKSTAP